MYYYSSQSSDIPKLNNTYGDFNTLINYLIDGGNPYSVTKITPFKDKYVKIYFTGTCPFDINQSITVSGSQYSYYNQNYLIDYIDNSNGFMNCYNSTIVGVTNDTDASSSIKMRVTPCGLTRKFGGVSDKRTVIKTSDGMEFRIDDRDFGTLLNPTVTTDPNWLKVARVCMSSNFESLDFTSSRMYPYNASRPSENFSTYGNYIGQSFIAYNLAYNDKTSIVDTNSVLQNPPFRIWANSNMIYIQISNASGFNDVNSRSFMFGSFNRANKSIPNGVLNTYKPPFQVYNQTTQYYDYSNIYSASNYASYVPTQYIHPLTPVSNRNIWEFSVFDNSLGSPKNVYTQGAYSCGCNAPSGRSGVLQYPNTVNGDIVFSDTLLTDGSYVYGTLYDIYWMNSGYSLDKDATIEINGNLYMSMRSDASISDNAKFTALIKLDRS